MKFPAMIAAVGLPSGGESGLNRTIRVDARKTVVNEIARDAIGALPWIALGLDAQGPSVVGPRTRHRRQHDEQHGTANCKAPKHGPPHIGWGRAARRQGRS